MIQINHTMSGAEVGYALADAPEELIYALEELAGRQSLFRDDLLDMIAGTTADNISAFLRGLADAIDSRQ